MELSVYLRLFIFTAGTLLYLFLLVLLAGLRRRRLLELLLFLTGLALFFFYAGGLLLLNLDLYYISNPGTTERLAIWLMAAGMIPFPALLIHTHLEVWKRFFKAPPTVVARALLGLAYIPFGFAIAFIPRSPAHLMSAPLSVLWPSWFCAAILISGTFHWLSSRRTPDVVQSRLHRILSYFFVLVAMAALFYFLFEVGVFGEWRELGPMLGSITALLDSLMLLPGAILGYFFIRQRFLPLGVQRHLVFTVTAAFLALIYLTLALRISDWLKDYLPPVATLSILLFVLVIFFEPLQRRVGELLQRSFRQEAERLQKLTAEIQNVARAGDLEQLVSFTELRLREHFALADARVILHGAPERAPVPSSRVQKFPLRTGADEIGSLEAWFFGQTLSGETSAALTYLAEQLPAAIDLCRLIDDKLRLERELAERERLALVGQMAASISHNLKNPLSSMKTLVQLQLENPDLPAPLRKDCTLVVEEIDRLSAKLGQLLQYARPSVRSGAGQLKVGVVTLAEQTVGLLRHEAERRGVALEFARPADELFTWGSDAAVSDILTNLLVNAIEALPSGGAVRLALERREAEIAITVTDDGPGISPEQQAQIFRPFFTTKPRGTGLGLAIVERRLAELKGTIRCESPVANARGTRFIVSLPAL